MELNNKNDNDVPTGDDEQPAQAIAPITPKRVDKTVKFEDESDYGESE